MLEPDRGRAISPQKPGQHFLSTGTEGDDAGLPSVGALVSGGPIQPHLPRPVDFRHRQPTHLTRPHPGQFLEPDHRSDWRPYERQDRGNVGRINRFDGLTLTGLGPPLLEAGNGAEGLVDTDRDEFPRRSPT